MDTATLIGVLLGSFLVGMAIVVGGAPTDYMNPSAVLIVVGGSTAATMTAFPMSRFLQLPRVVMQALYNKSSDPERLISQMVELAEVARRDGILALENMTEEMDDEFIVRGIQMAVDGTDPEIIQSIMETELENLLERHETYKAMVDSLGRYAPAFGMAGTLIGLVAMLRGMDDPSQIGSGMATALLTTLYGVLLANIVFLPTSDKLATRTNEEVLSKTIILQGVMSIQAGDNPRNVESKLMTFLPPSRRRSEDEAA